MKLSPNILLAGAILISGCAQHSTAVEPSYVSRNAYKGLTCNELTSDRNDIVRSVSALSKKQDASANLDGAAVAVGMILFWPALFVLAAPDSADQLASAKGHYNAITDRMVDKGCKLPPEPKPVAKPVKKSASYDPTNQLGSSNSNIVGTPSTPTD